MEKGYYLVQTMCSMKRLEVVQYNTKRGTTIFRDLSQLGRHRRGQHLRQCDLIDCITKFESEFDKSLNIS